ncbi:MAG TPA: PHP domain-containing protein, partial [Tianweitania sediminis]|nr:PHP domain-containing protein [Tianweitania sediminis]
MTTAGAAAAPYAEFGVQSNFSFLHGTSSGEQLVQQAVKLGYRAIGLADRNTVAGVVRAWSMARTAGIAFHPGSRLVFCDGTPDVLAYPQDRRGWGHLCRLLSQANLRDESPKGAPQVYKQDLLEWGNQISLAVLLGNTPVSEDLAAFLHELKRRFNGSVWLAVAPDYTSDHRLRLDEMAFLAQRTGLPLMATNDVLYHRPELGALQDVVTAIRLKTTVRDIGFARAANAERHMKPVDEMARLFRRHPQALAETLRFAGTLGFSLKMLEHNYPNEPTRDGATAQEELERLTWEGAARRFPEGVSDKVRQTLCKELDLVGELGYAGYFLTVYDIVTHARSKKILCQGRGSAANSLICYCLGITDIGPDRMDTLFERFISKERGEPPDIDVDFEHEKRDEVIAYIYDKYSQRHTALAAAVTSYRSRSALREVGKALGLSEDTIVALSSTSWRWSENDLGPREAGAAGLDMNDPLTRRFFTCANAILGFPRHLSQHVGGFV